MDGVDSGPEPPPVRAEDIPVEQLVSDPMSACPAPYNASRPSDGSNSNLMVAGQSREFFLILPPASYVGPRPLFIAFNGTTENGPGFAARAHLSDFAERGFVVAAPSSNRNGTVWPPWDDMRQPDDHTRPNPDVELFDVLVECLAGHYAIDRNRIYAGGHSAGGIFTNALVQRRSDVLAGAIVASGVFSLTSPPELEDLDEMFVLVTWGGPNDTYSGGDGITVPQINFVEQASIASTFYAEQPRVGHANCWDDVRHAWLWGINDWMVDLLLEHPKGASGAGGFELPSRSTGTARCSKDPFVFAPTIEVVCTESDVDGCQEACQFMGDCAVENSTVGPVLAPQLTMLGFSGAQNENCGGCVMGCESGASSAANSEVLSCLSTAQASTTCGPGIEGALPLINAIEACCDERADSSYCMGVCSRLLTSSVAESFFPNCAALTR